MSRHSARRPAVPRNLHVGRCPTCGKRRYVDKRDAKIAARGFDRTLRPYRCGEFWHLGHQPPGVREGVVDRRVLNVSAADRHTRGRRAA